MFLECSSTYKLLVLGVQLLFFIRTNQSDAQLRFIELTTALARQERNIIVNKRRFKTNLYMHNTKADE